MNYRDWELEELEERYGEGHAVDRPIPGKRSLTHGGFATSMLRPPPGKVPMTLELAPLDSADVAGATRPRSESLRPGRRSP